MASRRREVRESERPRAGQVMVIPYDKRDADDPTALIRVLALGVSFYLLPSSAAAPALRSASISSVTRPEESICFAWPAP